MSIDVAAFEPLTQRIIGAAIEVHRHLGPGLLESVYQECLARELASHELSFVSQQAAPIVYKGAPLSASCRLDLVVEGVVIVEIKSVAVLNAVHQAQTLTYMRIADCPIGLLINFNVPRLVDGVKRLVNPRAQRRGGNGEADSTERYRSSGETEHERSDGR
jgi:GxxExxY protein